MMQVRIVASSESGASLLRLSVTRIKRSVWHVCQISESGDSEVRPKSSKCQRTRPRCNQNSRHGSDCIRWTRYSTSPIAFASARIPFTDLLPRSVFHELPQSRDCLIARFIAIRKTYFLEPNLFLSVSGGFAVLFVEHRLVGEIVATSDRDCFECQRPQPASNLSVAAFVLEIGNQIEHGNARRRKLRSSSAVNNLNRCRFHDGSFSRPTIQSWHSNRAAAH